MRHNCLLRGLLIVGAICGVACAGEEFPEAVELALGRAGKNAAEIRRALVEASESHQQAMEFLVANMPPRDLESLSAEFLLQNVELAYRAWQDAPWHNQISEELFLNNILPYASVTESRDDWRGEFRERFLPLVKDAKSTGEAAAILNNKVFEAIGVRYSTKRRRPDQGPRESIESGVATCTGLSIILIDACRAVGVPARFVGTPLWSDRSGNHSWVEVWDDGWHYTGAAEPNGMSLDAGWFTQRAALAKRDEPRHAIYAVSFRQTPLSFPCVWSRRADYVSAVNVTDRYTANRQELPPGVGRAMFRVLSGAEGERVASDLRIETESGELLFEGQSKDEQFDTNDHTTAELKLGQAYRVQIEMPSGARETTIHFRRPDELFTFDLTALTTLDAPAANTDDPIEALRAYLDANGDSRPRLEDQPFAQASLTREQSDAARTLLWQDHLEQVRALRGAEMKERQLTAGELVMPFAFKTFGDTPPDGHSLFISLHGGGEAPQRVNDRQWENQKSLYEPSEGIYLAPRAPTDKWNMWHQEHIDGLFRRLIENMIAFENVNPNRVYLMGYSAGGDGVYQLAPRMADSWAAAAMMAGHPNDASPLGLRNIGFAIYVGGRDEAFQRNEVAKEWKNKLDELQQADPQGYRHLVEIPPDKGHWMDHLDAATVPWMAEFVRNPVPDQVVWKQDDVPRSNFYWLAVSPDKMRVGSEVVARRTGQQFEINAQGIEELTLRLDDRLVDLDEPVQVTSGGQVLYDGPATRRIATLAKTLTERGDPEFVFTAEVTVDVPKSPPPNDAET